MIVARQAWGAKPPKATPVPLPWAKVDTLVIHYSGALSDELPDYVDRVRGIQRFHQDARGWNDIAYNMLVSKTGVVYEGRGYGVMPAATLGHNQHTQAICFLGGDAAGRDDVTDAGRRAISYLIQLANKESTQTLDVKGHRDFNPTDCPGDELYAFVRTKGWQAYPSATYPPHFFLFAEWWLGEGRFKEYGPRNRQMRPAQLPARIPDELWNALEVFVAARAHT